MTEDKPNQFQEDSGEAFPAVSVIIPSYRRHTEVLRAAQSALGQTLAPVEVIVVNDGPDPKKRRLLRDINDERLRYLEAQWHGSAGATRNFGIAHAKGTWVALLDDDDWWLEEKLERQFRALRGSGCTQLVLAGVERTCLWDGSSRLRPRTQTAEVASVSRAILSGRGDVSTSTLLVPAQVCKEVRFNETENLLEDTEWLLNIGRSLQMLVVPAVIVERGYSEGARLSRSGDYEAAWRWYVRNKCLIEPEARVTALLQIVARRAAVDRCLKGIVRIFRELVRERRLTWQNVYALVRVFLLPPDVKNKLRDMLCGRRSKTRNGG
ncbi:MULTISPECIES: glycosyltransferase [unclassified Thioalkalivibrio]|uniref:glycosyltransferase family 2 protein n=1 Tax=unclassified Thioalkalivibrio TaxID=2621013 RepID=UPI0009D99A85|nr:MULTISPECIES: glycosyltransferase [unclassified Thioalkalivibrio]